MKTYVVGTHEYPQLNFHGKIRIRGPSGPVLPTSIGQVTGWGHFYFRFLAIDLQVAPILPTKFGVKWPFGSREEEQNRFSRWPS